MVAFTFICKQDGGSWSAKRFAEEEGPELEAEADSTYELEQTLTKLAIENANGGGVSRTLSYVTPKSAICQEKKEESEEEDEDMGFSLFD